MMKIAVFASGSGTNAENIINYFKESPLARVGLIVCDNPDAYVLKRAANHKIEALLVKRFALREYPEAIVEQLRKDKIDYIVLAGFLSLVPAAIVNEYKGRILNIHPALLPAYGGKGMYGDNVHRAVIANGEKESGITIHAVNEHYDEGAIVAQFKVEVTPEDTPETLAQKIHQLEYAHFPQTIEQELLKISK